MPTSFAVLIDSVEQELQDSSNNFWTAAELGIQLEEALSELSEYDPWRDRLRFEFESRRGVASSTTSNALVDATETQFASTDVGKVVFNKTDRTWAIVTAFISTSQLTLSRDIMVSGETYHLYNQDCYTRRQLYIGDVLDWVGRDHGVEYVEYPTQRTPPALKNFEINRDVLSVLISTDPPNSQDSNANIEVDVGFSRRHFVSQLTDLAGALTAGASEGATSIAVDGLSGTEVVAEHQEFTIAGLRGRYRVTDSGGVILSSGSGTLAVYPPLESDVENNDVVTFFASSLSQDQERKVVELCAGRAVLSKGILAIQQLDAAITSVSDVTTALALVAAKVLRQVADIASGRTAANLVATNVLDLANETALGNTEIDQAVATLDTARALVNTVTVGGPGVIDDYAAQVQQELATAQGYFGVAESRLREVQGNVEEVRAYAALAQGELQGAEGSINNALGYIQKITSDLNIVDRGREYTAMGQRKVNRVLSEISRKAKPTQKRQYTHDRGLV